MHLQLRVDFHTRASYLVHGPMTIPMPSSTQFATGYPAALSLLHGKEIPPQPDLVVGLFALLRHAGMNLGYSEADVLSGAATQFIYSKSDRDAADISFVPPIETLLRSLGAVWKEVTPSDPQAALQVMKSWIAGGALVMAKLSCTLLIYGYTTGKIEDETRATLACSTPSELILDSLAVARDYWRFPFDEANLLLRIESAPHEIPDPNQLCHLVSHRAVRAWRMPELAGCPTGRLAYDALIADLNGAESPPGLSVLMRRQYYGKTSAGMFFDRIAPRFGGAERKAFSRAGFCYHQCSEQWLSAARTLQLELRVATSASLRRDPDARAAAAEALVHGREWEQKATNELLRVVG